MRNSPARRIMLHRLTNRTASRKVVARRLFFWTSPRLLFAIAVICISTLSAQAIDFRTVALTDQPAAAMPDGFAIWNDFGAPSINALGQTAFAANLVRRGDSTNHSLWSEQAGALSPVTHKGDQAPGTPPGVVFDRFILGPDGSWPLNSQSQLSFIATVSGPGVNDSNDAGLWSQGTGTLELVARAGEPLPGGALGVTSPLFTQPRLNDSGETLFGGVLSGPGTVDGDNNGGIWVGKAGALRLIARSGSPVPAMPADVIFQMHQFSSADAPINGLGQVAFSADFAGPGVEEARNSGIWSDRSGSLEMIIREGDPAPGIPTGAVFGRTNGSNPFVALGLNDAGQTAFVGNVRARGLSDANDRGIWSEGTGTLKLVARTGNSAPGTPAGVVFERFQGRPLLNRHGQVAFSAEVVGPGVENTNEDGIWAEREGQLALVVREGDEAPGTPEGIVFGSISRPNISWNDASQVAFLSRLSGPEVSGSNDRGLWATDMDGKLMLIAREGDLFDVNDDPFVEDPRQIAFISTGRSPGGGEDGRNIHFNDAGQFAFTLGFTDGTRGVFVANTMPVPEPSTLAILALGAWLVAVSSIKGAQINRGRSHS